jgi:hypothetical protein
VPRVKGYPLPLAEIEKLYKTPGSKWSDYRAKLCCLLFLDGAVHTATQLTTLTVPQFLLDVGMLDMVSVVHPLRPETIEAARLWFACRRQRGSEQRVFTDYFGKPLSWPRLHGLKLKTAKVYNTYYHGLVHEWPWRVLGRWVYLVDLRYSYYARMIDSHPEVPYTNLFRLKSTRDAHHGYHRALETWEERGYR